MESEPARIGFGGGCHWCTEAVFAALRGIDRVEQGFIRSEPPHNSFSEAIVVEYRADEIGLETLIDVHLHSHASTSDHALRGKYRSAVYVFSAEQAAQAQDLMKRQQAAFDAPLVTRVLSLVEFRPSEEQFRNYAVTHAGGPFCRAYIHPKLAGLRSRHPNMMKPRCPEGGEAPPVSSRAC